jgi:hypothetical protein
MKKFVLTVDYELFLGDVTGTVKECMIEPMSKIASILDKNGSKMTIFWDILHYYKLLELETSFPVLRERRIWIEEQLIDMVRRGHDIQLHLHPHWLDAQYQDNKWHFIYDRFKLHSLSLENDPENINTIIGCVTIAKKLMEATIRQTYPNYKVTTFRAGGYLAEPFSAIKDALSRNDIRIDSSVCPGMHNPHHISSFDYRNYPRSLVYNFKLTPKTISETGEFTEIPISTIPLPIVINIFFKVLRRIRYPYLEKDRKGVGLADSYEDKTTSATMNLFHRLFTININQFTTDSNFKEKFNYLFKKAPSHSTMILHSKLLNNHTLKILDDYISENKFRFISIQEYLNSTRKLTVI